MQKRDIWDIWEGSLTACHQLRSVVWSCSRLQAQLQQDRLTANMSSYLVFMGAVHDAGESYGSVMVKVWWNQPPEHKIISPSWWMTLHAVYGRLQAVCGNAGRRVKYRSRKYIYVLSCFTDFFFFTQLPGLHIWASHAHVQVKHLTVTRDSC